MADKRYVKGAIHSEAGGTIPVLPTADILDFTVTTAAPIILPGAPSIIRMTTNGDVRFIFIANGGPVVGPQSILFLAGTEALVVPLDPATNLAYTQISIMAVTGTINVNIVKLGA